MAPEKPVRVLIVDDTLGMYVDNMAHVREAEMFSALGGNFEVYIAPDEQYALNMLGVWQSEGNPAQIVSIDYQQGSGGYTLSEIASEAKKQAGLLAEDVKFFVHSKSGLTAYPGSAQERTLELMAEVGAEYAHTFEFLHIAMCSGKLGPSPITLEQADNGSHSLRNYLASKFGIDFNGEAFQPGFIHSPREEEISDEPLSPFEIVDLVYERKLSPIEAIKRYDVEKALQGLAPRFEDDSYSDYSHGERFEVATGKRLVGPIVFSAKEAVEMHERLSTGPEANAHHKPILVIKDYAPEHLAALNYVGGVVLLGKGSKHLPILCEEHGITCLAGYDSNNLSLEANAGSFTLTRPGNEERNKAELRLSTGDIISLDYSFWNNFDLEGVTQKSGILIGKELAFQERDTDEYSYTAANQRIAEWADDVRRELKWHRKDSNLRDCDALQVKANADTPQQILSAIENGAEGIGLLRTEHMFLEKAPMAALQTALLAEDESTKQEALRLLGEFQQADFKAIFEAAQTAGQNFPVAVRLLDAPMEEFLPHPSDTAALERLCTSTGLSEERLAEKISQMRTDNARGGAFVSSHPGVYEAQLDAVFGAAREVGFAPDNLFLLHRLTSLTSRTLASAINPCILAYSSLSES